MSANRLRTFMPYLVFLIIYFGLFMLIFEIFFDNSGQIIEEDIDSHLWQVFWRNTAIQFALAPVAILVAQIAGQLSPKGLISVILLVAVFITALNFWSLDQLAAQPNEIRLLSIKGLLSYEYWHISFAQILGVSIVPAFTLVAINHLTRRLSRTRKRAA